MKLSLFLLAVIVVFSAQAMRLKQKSTYRQVGSSTIYSDINELDLDKSYYIVNAHFVKNFGKDLKGWLVMQHAGTFTVTKLSGSTYRLKHSSGKYLAINNNTRVFVSSKTSTTILTLTNKGNGICIEGSSGNYLRMYYQYVFPVGEYKTNVTSNCNAWEKWEFWYKNL